MITDGSGRLFSCICTDIYNKQLIASVQNITILKRQGTLHLLVGLPERDAFETLLTDCTALGVQQITPVIAAHCQRPWWKQSWDTTIDRFRSKMIAAMKQSLLPFLPVLNRPITLTGSFSTLSGTVLVADTEGDRLRDIKVQHDLTDTSCYIGPPGGFSDDEVNEIVKRNGIRVVIGKPRLRTELASIALCAQVIGYW
jgi:16S rRNA (uracil1498-N3)-methyltransferase